MAYAAVTSLLQTMDLVISPDANFTPRDDDRFASLVEKLMHLKGFLEVSVRRHGDLEKGKILEKRIEEVVHRAEDIIEMHFYGMRSKGKIKKRSRRKDYKTFQQGMKHVVEQINLIEEETATGRGDQSNLHSGRYILGGSSTWHSPNCESTIVGMENDLVKIKDQLTGSSCNLEITTIVGMGGIGKSTLAKMLYDDPLIVYRFYVRAWITVSQDYRVKTMLLGLIRFVAQLTDDVRAKYDDPDEQNRVILKDGINQLSDQSLAEQLYRSLKGKRYLIVMDDVWCSDAWDDVRRSFPDDKNGSRIILTSRLKEVALRVNAKSAPHHMQFLSVDEGWELLKSKVFSKRQGCASEELEEIGRRIVDKCRGPP